MSADIVYLARGQTVQWTTTFRNSKGAVVQPPSAWINVAYYINGVASTTLIQMQAPAAPAVEWVGQWDTRGADPGLTSWSIHTEDTQAPFSVEDGQIELTANAANLRTFAS